MDTKHSTTPNEDLMEEHGLLNRILIIYEEIVNKLDEKLNRTIVYYVAGIVRDFIEGYHEKNEEKYVFPLLIKNKKHVDLVNELIRQHRVSQLLTKKIINLSKSENPDISKLKLYIILFVKMYRYHESREDTIIFRTYRNLMSKEEYDKIGEKLEKSEDEILGELGYDNFLNAIELIEKKLKIYDIGIITKEVVELTK